MSSDCIECGRDLDNPSSFRGYCSTCSEIEEMEQEKPQSFITVLDLAKFRGVKEDADGSINMGSFIYVGLAMLGGCQNCMAQCAAYNMCPTKTGNCSCLECVHAGNGFETVEEANQFCFPHEYVWLGVNRVADKTEPDQMKSLPSIF